MSDYRKNNKIPKMEDVERFLSKIRVDFETGCWNWIGASNGHGYGVVIKTTDKKRQYRAHRVSFDIFKGIENEEDPIDHTCMNRACVNPDHLRQVNHRVNAIENSNSMSARYAKRTHCSKGHEYTEENVFYRKNSFSRNCKQCNRDNANDYYMKRGAYGSSVI